MSGPSPARDEERSTKAKTPVKAVLDVDATPALGGGIPPPPPGLSAELEAQWSQLWAEPTAWLIATSDVPALRRLWSLRQRYDDLFELAFSEATVDVDVGDEEPRQLPIPPGLALGSQGQLVEHPALKAALAIEKSITALEDRFALSTKARQNMGIRIGKLADAAKRHPELLDGGDEEPAARADPRLANAITVAAEPRGPGPGLDGGEPRPRRG